MSKNLICLSLLFCSSMSQLVVAESRLIDNSPHFGETGWSGNVELGVFVANAEYEPYPTEDDAENGGLVYVEASYFSDQFYFQGNRREGLLLGYTFFQQQNWAIDGLLSPRFFGTFDLDLIDDLDTIDERKPDLHIGLRLSTYFEDSLLRLELSQDISENHDGHIFSVSYDKEWQFKNWIFTGSATLAYASEEMTDYYFGIDADEASSVLPVYQVEDTVIANLEIDAEYPLNENWTYRSNLSYLTLGDEIKDSPISNDDDLIVFTNSLKYHFR